MDPLTITAVTVSIVAGIATTWVALSRARNEAKRLHHEVFLLSRQLRQQENELWIPDNSNSAVRELNRYLAEIEQINDRQLRSEYKFTNAEIADTKRLTSELNKLNALFRTDEAFITPILEFHARNVAQLTMELKSSHRWGN